MFFLHTQLNRCTVVFMKPKPFEKKIASTIIYSFISILQVTVIPIFINDYVKCCECENTMLSYKKKTQTGLDWEKKTGIILILMPIVTVLLSHGEFIRGEEVIV